MNRRSLAVIVGALHDAWGEIATFEYVKTQPFKPEHLDDEDELSTKLMEILNYRLDHGLGGQFNKKKFQQVVRDGKQSTADLTSYDQMPDLTIRMMVTANGEDRDESGLFIEAKLVDRDRGCRAYVVQGLHRFVSGKYAPRVTFGLMLAYTREDYAQADEHLGRYYEAASGAEAKACAAKVTPSDVHDACFVTHHKRKHPCPPDFRAMHVWLVRPPTN